MIERYDNFIKTRSWRKEPPQLREKKNPAPELENKNYTIKIN